MICPKCGSELDIFSSCETDKSVWQIRAENTKVELMLMQARAEKAERELKAIKAMIEEIAEFAKTIATPYKSELIHNILELQKQIGGEK